MWASFLEPAPKVSNLSPSEAANEDYQSCVERVKADMKAIGSTTPLETIEKGCKISTSR